MTVAGRMMIWLGGLALLAAALLDGLGVVGRFFGLPIHGVIELVQATVLIAGGVAIIAATAAANHAKVHLLLDRMPSGMRRVMELVSHGLSALFFMAMLAGGLWLSADLWGGHERSELLAVPYAALRAFANLCLGTVIGLVLYQAFRGHKA